MKVDHPDSTSSDTLTYGKGSKDCFTGDTKILVFNSKKELISLDLKTLSLNENWKNYTLLNYDYKGKFKESEIVDVFMNKVTTNLVEIEMEDGYIFKCTPDHLILTKEGYKEAKTLTHVEDIISMNDFTKVTKKISSIKTLIEKSSVYDLTAKEDFNFLLENGIVVHNCADGLSGAIEAINRDIDKFTGISKPEARRQFTNYLRTRTASNKDAVLKDAKKMMKTGGYKKFIKKEEERNLCLKEVDIKIPEVRRKRF